jgi:hypothetical protein
MIVMACDPLRAFARMQQKHHCFHPRSGSGESVATRERRAGSLELRETNRSRIWSWGVARPPEKAAKGRRRTIYNWGGAKGFPATARD